MQRILARALLLALIGTSFSLGAHAQDWNEQVRTSVKEHDLQTALQIVNARLTSHPEDSDALAWHARILSWQGEWRNAESEYRRVLETSPQNTDVLLGLADVLFWQGKYQEVTLLLDRAAAVGAPAEEISWRRARPQPTKVETPDPARTETLRYELRVGNDTDFFNFTDVANAQTVSLLATWNPRWRSAFTGQTFQRFGATAQKVGATVSYGITPHSYIGIGGAVANKQDVISRFDENAELGRTFPVQRGTVRGLETVLEQKGLWFTNSQVTLLRGTAIVYFPHDWIWSLSLSGARSQFDAAGSSWTSAGSSKLSFPLQRYVAGNLFYGIGSENYTISDQIGEFSAHTYGGGLRFHLTNYQDISAYGAFQQRSQGRTQTSMGFNYGIRF